MFLLPILLANLLLSPVKAELFSLSAHLEETEEEVMELMDKGDIPGLSLVIIREDKQIIKTFGYANSEKKQPVTPYTLFEIGSCTKAFTALAVTRLEKEGMISLDENVSYYLPWFYVTYQDTIVNITLRQLLHHTSGIPWTTIAKIPESDNENALEVTVRMLTGQELDELPGTKYEYATINYDILALIVQEVSEVSFEEYLSRQIINPLGLEFTSIGKPIQEDLMSNGYKISFFAARKYNAPIFRGNFAAGYVITNAVDLSKWLKLQMGISQTEFSSLIKDTHIRDKSVPLHGMNAYARGWELSLDGTGTLFHNGLNPNFTAYVSFRPEEKLAIGLLANSNSKYTEYIGETLMKKIAGEKIEKKLYPDDNNDGLYSSLTIILALYSVVALFYIIKIVVDILKSRRNYLSLTSFRFLKIVVSVVILLPFFYGGYILPKAIAQFNWQSIMVWSPFSFGWMMWAILIAVCISYAAYVLCMLFPNPDKYRQVIPSIILLSILSGLANVVVIIMVTSSIGSDQNLAYKIFYYGLVLVTYLMGRWYVQTQLIKLTRSLIYDLNIKLIQKIFSTSYENFEKIERGRVYSTFNDDINVIGQSTNVILTLITSVITAIGAFVYLASIASWSTLIVFLLIITLASLYYIVIKNTNKYFEEARNSRDIFMQYFNGMVDGFRELSLHRRKKREYKSDISDSAVEFRDKITEADIRFVNAFLVGESLLILLLGFVSFGMHELFPTLPFNALMSFVVILLYLIGPINGILNSVPQIMRLKISWKRVNGFISVIPANQNLQTPIGKSFKNVNVICADNIIYKYKNKEGANIFTVGPINLQVKKGQICFIVGGNGSGKTTLAKLLTGLYSPTQGHVSINGKPVESQELGEYYSTVFSSPYIFKKLYNIQEAKKRKAIDKYLDILALSHKVQIADNQYSTVNLSGGQRKRLALLQCYLEDSPVYLFDEWAADQDPQYKYFFYRTLLPEMKKAGKIVIAITHDDHYFDIADFVIKMDQGKLIYCSDENFWLTEKAPNSFNPSL